MEAEFEKIDKNGGGQILFSEFVDWALERNLDIEDDVDEDQPWEQNVGNCFLLNIVKQAFI